MVGPISNLDASTYVGLSYAKADVKTGQYGMGLKPATLNKSVENMVKELISVPKGAYDLQKEGGNQLLKGTKLALESINRAIPEDSPDLGSVVKAIQAGLSVSK